MITWNKINKALIDLEARQPPQQQQDELTLPELFFYGYLRIDKTGTVVRTPRSQNIAELQPMADWLNEQRKQEAVFILHNPQELENILAELAGDNFIMSPSFKGNDLINPDRYTVFIKWGLNDATGYYARLAREMNVTIDAYCHQTGTPYPVTIEQVETLLTGFLADLG